MRVFLSGILFLLTSICAALPKDLASLEDLESIYRGRVPAGVAAVLRLPAFQKALCDKNPAYKKLSAHYFDAGQSLQSREMALIKMREIEQHYIREMRTTKRLRGANPQNTQWMEAGLRAAVEGSFMSFSGLDVLHKMGLSGNLQGVFFIEHQLDHMSKVLAVLHNGAAHALYFQSEQPDLSSHSTSPLSQRIKQNLRIDNVRYMKFSPLAMTFNTFGITVVNFSGSYLCNTGRTSFMRTIANNPDVVFIQSMGNANKSFPEAYVLNLDHMQEVRERRRHESLVGKDFSLVPKVVQFDNFVLAIAITKDREVTSFSSRPGGAKDYEKTTARVIEAIQNMSVCALGQDVLIHDIDGNDVRVSGTSFAAPIISATATLLRGAFPKLSAADITQAILRSADKDFFVSQGRGGKFICSTSFPLKRQKGCAYQKFDPSYYGCGILNAKLAYDFAAMRSNYPEKSIEGITEMFREYQKNREMLAAKKIQEAWRRRHGKVSLRVKKLRRDNEQDKKVIAEKAAAAAKAAAEAKRARIQRRQKASEAKRLAHEAKVAKKAEEEKIKVRTQLDAQYNKGRLSEVDMKHAISVAQGKKQDVRAPMAVMERYTKFLDMLVAGCSEKTARTNRRAYYGAYETQKVFFEDNFKKYQAHQQYRARVARRNAAEAAEKERLRIDAEKKESAYRAVRAAEEEAMRRAAVERSRREAVAERRARSKKK